MKGFAPIVLALIVVILVVYTLVMAYLIGKTETSYRAQVEKSIIGAINKMEFVKREIPVAISYSFYQASFDLAARGGYETYSLSYNCIPYWKVFSQDNTLDASSNLQNLFPRIFEKYTSAMSDYILTFPSFQANIDTSSGTIKVFSADDITISNPNFYTVRDKSSFTEPVDTRVFKMFDVGKDFSDQISQAISSSSSYSDGIVKVAEAQNNFNVNNAGQFSANVQIESNQGDDNNFAFRSLVTITDISNDKHPIFDFSTNQNAYENLKLNFYILDGKDSNIQPITNVCQPIAY